MRFAQTLVFFSAVLFSGCVAKGPASDENPDDQQFSGETPSGDWSVEIRSDSTVVTFNGEDASLRLEAVNGAERPVDVQQEHPELGKYEVDERIIDRNGIPFVMGIGGDTFADPSWGEDYENSLDVSVDPNDRAGHHALLMDVQNAIEFVGVLNFRHTDLLLGLVRSLNIERATESNDGQFGDSGDSGEISVEPPPPPATTYNHYVYVYYSSIYWGWGDHSDTRALSKNSAGTITYYDLFYGNHGRYYYESGMSYTCGGSWTGRASKTLAYSPYSGTDTSSGNVGGGCSTGYSAILPYPGISDDGKHVCNDDSYAQYGNVKYNSLSSWSTCGDNTLNRYVPVCSSI